MRATQTIAMISLDTRRAVRHTVIPLLSHFRTVWDAETAPPIKNPAFSGGNAREISCADNINTAFALGKN